MRFNAIYLCVLSNDLKCTFQYQVTLQVHQTVRFNDQYRHVTFHIHQDVRFNAKYHWVTSYEPKCTFSLHVRLHVHQNARFNDPLGGGPYSTNTNQLDNRWCII